MTLYELFIVLIRKDFKYKEVFVQIWQSERLLFI